MVVCFTEGIRSKRRARGGEQLCPCLCPTWLGSDRNRLRLIILLPSTGMCLRLRNSSLSLTLLLLHLFYPPLQLRRTSSLVERYTPMMTRSAHRSRLWCRDVHDRASRRETTMEGRGKNPPFGVLELTIRTRTRRSKSAWLSRRSRRMKEHTSRSCALCPEPAWYLILRRVRSVGRRRSIMRWFDMFHSRWVQHGRTDVGLDTILVFTVLAILARLIAKHYAAFWCGNW